jgi:hypothetical protein
MIARRRAISFALNPASTSTRVLPATINTALPVDPLPRTVSFMKLALAQIEEGSHEFTIEMISTRAEI